MSDQPTTPSDTPPCSTHPDAPHGFDRDGSHTAGRYVCDCEGWVPPDDTPSAAPTTNPQQISSSLVDAPGAAPTPETPETEAVMTDPLRDGNDLPALARRLERERDEARAELAKLKTPTPPAEGSAVEEGITWEQAQQMGLEMVIADFNRVRAQLSAAQARADEAEQYINSIKSLTWYQAGYKDGAQAEAAEMRKQRDLGGAQVITLTAEIKRLRKGITEIKAGTRIGWFMTDLGAKCEKLLNP